MATSSPSNPVLNERWLKRASWWVRHHHQLRLTILILTVLVEASLLSYSGYVWFDYLVLGRRRQAALERDLSDAVDMRPLHQALAPQPIAVPTTVVLPGSGAAGAYDVLVKLKNPNPQWVATVTYAFAGDEGLDPAQPVVVLNAEERFVIGVGVARSVSAKPAVTVTNIGWRRLREPARFDDGKPRFVVSDVTFLPAAEAGRRDSRLPLSQVRFTVSNESVASFWSVGFTVVLLQGDRPVAARYTTLEQFQSGEQREVSLNLYTSIPTVTTVLVVPDVNILDPSVFMPLRGGPVGF